MPGKKQKFGEAKSPFEMKGSPHKLGTIEGTSAFKARFTVEQTRTTGDAAIVGAASELGSSYVPGAIDYGLDVGFKTKDKEEKSKKKNEKKKNEKKKDKEIKLDKVSELGDFGTEAKYWQSGGGFGKKTFIDPAHKTTKPRKKIKVKGKPTTGKEIKKDDRWTSSWDEYIK